MGSFGNIVNNQMTVIMEDKFIIGCSMEIGLEEVV